MNFPSIYPSHVCMRAGVAYLQLKTETCGSLAVRGRCDWRLSIYLVCGIDKSSHTRGNGLRVAMMVHTPTSKILVSFWVANPSRIVPRWILGTWTAWWPKFPVTRVHIVGLSHSCLYLGVVSPCVAPPYTSTEASGGHGSGSPQRCSISFPSFQKYQPTFTNFFKL